MNLTIETQPSKPPRGTKVGAKVTRAGKASSKRAAKSSSKPAKSPSGKKK